MLSFDSVGRETVIAQGSASVPFLTGWVGIVWSTENTLMKTVNPLDQLESLRFLADYS